MSTQPATRARFTHDRAPERGLLPWLRRAGQTLRASVPLLTGYAVFIVVMGTLTGLVEHWALGEGIWWAEVTTTTVGYGDFTPHTLIGRYVLGSITMLGGIYTVALLVGTVVSTRDAWTHDEQQQLFRTLYATEDELAEVKGLLHTLLQRLPEGTLTGGDLAPAPAVDPTTGAGAPQPGLATP
jgi:hypothetical protein